MGFFDKIVDMIKVADKVVKNVEDIVGTKEEKKTDNKADNKSEDIVIAPASHIVEDTAFWDDNEYKVSFKLNDSFKEAQSHAGEVEMLNTYAPFAEYGEEGEYPYVAIMNDNKVYCAVKEFKEKGTFKGAIELTALNDKFYFKAKTEYFDNMMYFYGMDRCGGANENSGLCIVYPKAYVGTENEKKIMNVLDEAAQSYSEE